MKKVYGFFLGIGMLVVSGNATAIMITSGGNDTEISHDVLMQVAAGDFSETRREQKLARKVGKLMRKINRYEFLLETRGLNTKRERKLAQLENRLLQILALMDLPDFSSLATSENGPGTTSAGNPPNAWFDGVVESTGLGESGTDTNNVPEPFTLALLGIGLIGIGASRRLKKAA